MGREGSGSLGGRGEGRKGVWKVKGGNNWELWEQGKVGSGVKFGRLGVGQIVHIRIQEKFSHVG